MQEIYLDNSATTRPCPEALEAYLSAAEHSFGNPSSLHALGKGAEDILTAARKTLLKTIGARSGELVFTASGTEANNLAIFGRAHAKERFARRRILTTAGEHASVTLPLDALAREGFEIIEIPTRGGELDLCALAQAATDRVILATMMLVNNETGAIYDIPAVSRILKANCPDAALHVDATQAYMKLPISVEASGADMLTISAHKIEGVKGAGGLYIAKHLITSRGITPQILGGGQEGGFRSGTENVPAVAAFAKAAECGQKTLPSRMQRIAALRRHFEGRLSSDPALAEYRIHKGARCAPHILSLASPGIKSETLLHYLSSRGIYVSSGSACSSHGKHGSPALLAFGVSENEADATVRISLSHRNTEAELDRLADALVYAAEELIRAY